MNKKLYLGGLSLAVLTLSALVFGQQKAPASAPVVPYGYVSPMAVTIETGGNTTIKYFYCIPVGSPPVSRCGAKSATWSSSGGHLSVTVGASATFTAVPLGTYYVYADKTHRCKITVVEPPVK